MTTRTLDNDDESGQDDTNLERTIDADEGGAAVHVAGNGSSGRMGGGLRSLWQNSFVRLGVIIGVAALLGAFATYRFGWAGQWVPELPVTVGVWTATDMPLPDATLAILGNPKAQGRVYTNLFNEGVSASVISAGSFDNYHDPTVCGTGNGFSMTAKKILHLDTKRGAAARVMIFRRGEDRILLYYWQQTRSGGTDTAARMGNYRDIVARVVTGFSAIVMGDQTCLVRVYAMIPPNDKEGAQTQRNVADISQALYHALLPPDKKNTSDEEKDKEAAL